MTKLPTGRQLLLPLLEELVSQGGTAPPGALYDGVAQRISLPPELRSAKISYRRRRGADTGSVDRANLYQRALRWARQTGIESGHLDGSTPGIWRITGQGRRAVDQIRPGLILTVFVTACGRALLAHAEDARAVVEAGSCSLIYTSPPYPLRQPMPYTGSADARGEQAWTSWLLRLAETWHDLLTPDGSLMLNLGYTFEPGLPVQSLAVERLTLALVDKIGFHLADRLFWHNPLKLPGQQWVAVRRVRQKATVEPILWLAKSEHPYADNRQVLEPYSPATRAWLERTEGSRRDRDRPSGMVVNEDSFARDRGGAIPSNLIQATPEGPNSTWRRLCKEAGLAQHPAMSPVALPDRAVRLATRPGSLVYDPFLGSGTTAVAAEKNGRRWIGTERSPAYLAAAALRPEFTTAAGYELHEPPAGR